MCHSCLFGRITRVTKHTSEHGASPSSGAGAGRTRTQSIDDRASRDSGNWQEQLLHAHNLQDMHEHAITKLRQQHSPIRVCPRNSAFLELAVITIALVAALHHYPSTSTRSASPLIELYQSLPPIHIQLLCLLLVRNRYTTGDLDHLLHTLGFIRCTQHVVYSFVANTVVVSLELWYW
jgi:hypothetical protein